MSPKPQTWTSPALPVGPRVPVWAPAAQTVELHLPDQDRLVGMIPVPGGWWTAPFDLEPGTDYAFRVDGSPNRPDPRSALQPDGVHGPSRTVDPDTWRWTDQNWAGRDLRGSVIYELHVGTFTPEGTLDAAISRLGHLVDLGVDIVELMPLAAFPGKAGWGYDGVGLWAVHEAYGGPDALARFVDAAHNAGIGVCLDVVYNHLGPSGNYLSVFGPYFTPAHHTPWGEAVNYDHDGSQQVRAFVIDSALRWMRDFHIDALRLDAIHEIKDDAAAAATPQRHVLAELSDAVAALSIELGRPLSLVAEADLNDVGVITPTSEEPPAKVPSLGMTAQWADDVHHALHVRLTGEDQGYYGDFAEVGAWAKAYGRAFLHNGTWSTFRERNWGAPVPEDTDPRRFVVFGSDHDQVGNRAVGDRPSAILDDAALAATAALVLLSPYTPMLFMGEEWGTRTPFQFFTDHEEDDLARSVSEGRVREFAGFGWDADEIPDPQAAATVEASRLRWSELDEAEHARMLAWYQALTTLRRNLDWSQRTAWPQVDEIDDVLMVTYDDIVVAANLSGQERPAPALTTVLLSWDPFDAATPSLSPGQTLIARR
ncbi:malto-oligosyltrehalose trehalohydrolase [Actinomyces naeslundii]|uniref:Malto-oligosyltrehalose trehalohydrolase n=1 Tax=Actinomyces naeslundii TaxID=1655 RepID=A0AA47FF97_ACTNA|nr:malto-oligosyltrehalose trehalohydrolase [Actinomyces naeslundii]OMG16632.1 malto-oligosyltrehalose trehalohydrolase [Actinomyces naeslundii]PKY94249.1 malto-oligosyltrehalose trehalohydrolase [Actinomyces naeslundii]WAL42130.1 malto-oligosyltrehalose trehalohydrolase [Actinomyces naeslundii]